MPFIKVSFFHQFERSYVLPGILLELSPTHR